MMTVERFMIDRITEHFNGEFWGNLTREEREMLGDWRADEKLVYYIGEMVTLYSEIGFLSVRGMWDGEYYHPIGSSQIKKVSKDVWLKATQRVEGC